MDSKFNKLLEKLKPLENKDDYVSDPYNINDMVNEVSDSSLTMNPEEVHKILNAESTGGQNLKNPNSSAEGNFQFLKGTKQDTLNKLQDEGEEVSTNPLRQDAQLMKNLVGRGEEALLNKNIDPDMEKLYMLHHYGIQGGLHAIKNPNEELSKARFRNIRAQLAKKPLDNSQSQSVPAQNLLDLIKPE